MSAPQPRDGELLILSKLEHLEKDVQALAPLLEKIIAHLAAQKTPEKPKLASYDQLYPTLQPPAPVEEEEAVVKDLSYGGWGRLFPNRRKA